MGGVGISWLKIKQVVGKGVETIWKIYFSRRAHFRLYILDFCQYTPLDIVSCHEHKKLIGSEDDLSHRC